MFFKSLCHFGSMFFNCPDFAEYLIKKLQFQFEENWCKIPEPILTLVEHFWRESGPTDTNLPLWGKDCFDLKAWKMNKHAGKALCLPLTCIKAENPFLSAGAPPPAPLFFKGRDEYLQLPGWRSQLPNKFAQNNFYLSLVPAVYFLVTLQNLSSFDSQTIFLCWKDI